LILLGRASFNFDFKTERENNISSMFGTDNAVVDAIKLILLNYSNFSIAKIVVKKIERVK